MSSLNESSQPVRLARRGIPSLAGFAQRSRMPAWVLSLAMHATLLALMAALWTPRPRGTGAEPGGPVGIAVVSEHAGGEDFELMGGASQTTFDATSGGSAASNLEDSLSGVPALDSSDSAQASLMGELLPDLSGPNGSGANASGTPGLATGGLGLSLGGTSGSVKAKLFGVEGEGHRFVYVIDRSDSMNGYEGKPWRKAKQELLGSLQSLGSTHQFQIIFYNDSPTPHGGFSGRGPQLLHGDERSKEMAERFVNQMVAIGGTNHIDALRMALAMGPDVLFFLTDGDFPRPDDAAIENLLTRAARGGTAIHCIQFGEGSRSDRSRWISNLAESSGGKFRYIDVAEF